MKELIIAFGLFLFIEGILYAIFPAKMKSMLKKLELVSNSQLRTDGINFSAKSANEPGISLEKDFTWKFIINRVVTKSIFNLFILAFNEVNNDKPN